MSWHLFLLVISACLIQDIQSAPKLVALGNNSDMSLSDQLTPCEQCQTLEIAILWSKFETEPALTVVENACDDSAMQPTYQNICTLIQGKEVEFVDTVLDFKKNGKEKELCSNLSMCHPSRKDWVWKPESLNTCEQCQMAIFQSAQRLPDELPYERLQYYAKTADSLKELCRDTFTRDYFSSFCPLIDGKEPEIVKSALDCSGAKFKDDEVQPNCTVPFPNSLRRTKACERFVDSCKVDQ
ncbi:hypothetical protein Ddc_17014 [Ditylenchus destructor]|nr:hypothetical protein Ddc_17014 [Ditylenchus destructor]